MRKETPHHSDVQVTSTRLPPVVTSSAQTAMTISGSSINLSSLHSLDQGLPASRETLQGQNSSRLRHQLTGDDVTHDVTGRVRSREICSRLSKDILGSGGVLNQTSFRNLQKMSALKVVRKSNNSLKFPGKNLPN